MKKLLALSLLFVTAAANAVTFNVTQLSALSAGDDAGAYGMNDNGAVVGNAYNPNSGLIEAVVWNNGVIQSLGIQGIARAVNNSGTVVGENSETGTLNRTGDGRAYKWDSTNGYLDLGDVGGTYTGAYDINDSGVITGNSFSNYSPFGLLQMHAYRWENGTMTDLPPPNPTAGYSRGIGINEAGTIVGRASLDTFTNSDKYMAQWDPSNTFTHNTGPFGYSSGRDINNNNISVGLAKNAAGDDRAAIWDASGSITMLNTFGGTRSLFSAINDSGIAVGMSTDASDTNIAMISFDGTTIVDLNTIIDLTGTGFVQLNEAFDINAAGEIVGIGTLSNGSQGAFVLTAVPVPAAVWLFASALGFLGWRRKRAA